MVDIELGRRVKLFMQQRGVSSVPQLSIQVEDGQVVLQGTVSSYYERQLCLLPARCGCFASC